MTSTTTNFKTAGSEKKFDICEKRNTMNTNSMTTPQLNNYIISAIQHIREKEDPGKKKLPSVKKILKNSGVEPPTQWNKSLRSFKDYLELDITTDEYRKSVAEWIVEKSEWKKHFIEQTVEKETVEQTVEKETVEQTVEEEEEEISIDDDTSTEELPAMTADEKFLQDFVEKSEPTAEQRRIAELEKQLEELKKYAPKPKKPVIDHKKNLDDFMESIGLSMEDGEKFLQLYNLAKKKKTSTGERAAPVRAPEGFIKSFRVSLKELTEPSTKRFYMKDGTICEYNAAYSYKNNPAFKQYMDNSGTMKKKPHTWSNSTKVIPGSMGLKQGQDYYIYKEGERPEINWN